MNDEIKEILDYLKDEENTRRIKCITIEESKQLLDYITNLQLYKYRCEKALEYLDKIETLAMSDGKIIFSINIFRNILQNEKKYIVRLNYYFLIDINYK